MGSIPGLFFRMQGGFRRLFQPLAEHYRTVDLAAWHCPALGAMGIECAQPGLRHRLNKADSPGRGLQAVARIEPHRENRCRYSTA